MDQLKTLFDDIQSGDLSAAQQDYSTLQSSMSSSSTSSTTSSSSSSDPMSQMLSQIGSALESGDISSAQSVVTSFLENAPPPPPSDGSSSSTSGSSSSGQTQALTSDQESFRDEFLNLLDAIQSGDLSSAQDSYSSLESMLSSSDSTSSVASTTSSSTTSSSDSSSSSSIAPDAVLQLLSQLGSALTSGNLTTASQEVSSFISNIPEGSMVDTVA